MAKRLSAGASRRSATTRAPSSSRRLVSHEPMNPCAPVTSAGRPREGPLLPRRGGAAASRERVEEKRVVVGVHAAADAGGAEGRDLVLAGQPLERPALEHVVLAHV